MGRLLALGAAVLLAAGLGACGSSPATRATSGQSATTTPVPNLEATATRQAELAELATSRAPTATAAATSTRAPAATAGASPAAAPTATRPASPTSAAKVDVAARNVSSSRDSIGGLWFIGEVVNQGQADAAQIQVALSLIGAGGETLASGSVSQYSFPVPLLRPGEKSAWRALMDKNPDAWQEERVQVQAGPPLQTLRADYTREVKVEGMTVAVGQFGLVTASGQAVNRGTVAARSVRITVGLYDEAGTLVAVGEGYAKLEQIPPGGSAPFSADFPSLKQPPPKAEAFVYARTVP
jgi:hypothetical protein